MAVGFPLYVHSQTMYCSGLSVDKYLPIKCWTEHSAVLLWQSVFSKILPFSWVVLLVSTIAFIWLSEWFWIDFLTSSCHWKWQSWSDNRCITMNDDFSVTWAGFTNGFHLWLCHLWKSKGNSLMHDLRFVIYSKLYHSVHINTSHCSE